MFRAVRGAITVAADDPNLVREAVARLIGTLMADNHLQAEDLNSVLFTVTPDLVSLNPASAVREVRSDWAGVPMMCAQEPVVTGMLPRCVRVMIQAEFSHVPVPAYLGEAGALRPDLV